VLAVFSKITEYGKVEATSARGRAGKENPDRCRRLTRSNGAQPGPEHAAVGFIERFVSGAAEHQGPDGGGPVAVIARYA